MGKANRPRGGVALRFGEPSKSKKRKLRGRAITVRRSSRGVDTFASEITSSCSLGSTAGSKQPFDPMIPNQVNLHPPVEDDDEDRGRSCSNLVPNEIQVETLCKTDGVPLDIASQATLVS